MAQYGSKIRGNTLFWKSLLGCPAQRPEQVEQTLCSLGKPLSRATALVVWLCPHAGLQQQRLWLEVEMAGSAEAGAGALRLCLGRCIKYAWTRILPSWARQAQPSWSVPMAVFVLLLAWNCSLVFFEAAGAPP